jgi:hypothetical protein
LCGPRTTVNQSRAGALCAERIRTKIFSEKCRFQRGSIVLEHDKEPARFIASKMIVFINIKTMAKTLVDPMSRALYERDKSQKVEARRTLAKTKGIAVA